MFEELSDSALIVDIVGEKLSVGGLIYGLLILMVELYDFDTCAMIFLNT